MIRLKDYSLIKINPDQRDQIESLINLNNGSVFHEPILNEIASKYHKTDFYYLVNDPDIIKIACPVHVTKYDFGRKLYQLKPPGDIPYAGFVGELTELDQYLKIGLNDALIYAGFPTQNLTELSEEESGLTSMVDLSLSENDIFMKVINAKRRNMIRKAVKSGIEVKAFLDKDGLEIFWPILLSLHIKLGYQKLQKDYYESLFNQYSKKGKSVILIAYKGEKAVSGLLLLGNNNYMHYYKGASVTGTLNEGQGELLQWEAIKWAKGKSKFYDLCNLNRESLPEIYRFKTGISDQLFFYRKFKMKSLGFKILNRLS
ncbi:femAB family [Lentimicrobium saccharophilum]|uniref:FemAB family n=1 Tax=Lentimicrobium saccharophilum TaxID=1678841 RepID=A0A0S7C118_9BACT|nr:GNAT family N-acetyltransferase [Lentimicrobium saccharophilum]GAP42351.1 femAB family [Lentimicrobium saccharophilum]